MQVFYFINSFKSEVKCNQIVYHYQHYLERFFLIYKFCKDPLHWDLYCLFWLMATQLKWLYIFWNDIHMLNVFNISFQLFFCNFCAIHIVIWIIVSDSLSLFHFAIGTHTVCLLIYEKFNGIQKQNWLNINYVKHHLKCNTHVNLISSFYTALFNHLLN